MPSSDLVVQAHGVRPDGPTAVFRRRLHGYVVAGIALSGWVGFLLLSAAVLLRPAGEDAARTSGAGGVVWLLVGPLIVADPGVATALPIQVGPSAPPGSWIKITGIPALASLSAGHTVGAGAWKVPVAALSTLTITAPSRDSVRTSIRLSLMSAAGLPLTETGAVLAVMPPELCGATATYASKSPPDDVPSGAVYRPSGGKLLPVLTSDEDRRRADELVLLGEIQRLQGRFNSARGYFEQAAIMGWARGALALAATFDPHEISGTAVRPDIEAARAWYKRSGDLMDAAVAYYLKRLAQ